MKKLTCIFFGIAFFGLLISCDKNDPKIRILNKEARVLDHGEPALDGCGWIIQIDSVDYKPTNLSEKYRVDGLYIVLDYELNDTRLSCGVEANVMDEINIIQLALDRKILKTGVIKDYGNPALDGCGWVIGIGDADYYPINLAPEFEQNGLEVLLQYSLLADKANCGFQPDMFDRIEIGYMVEDIEEE